MKHLSLVFFLLVAIVPLRSAQPTLTIDVAKPVGTVSPRLYGLMTEEINFSYDGGLYAELIRNRAFLDKPDAPANWSAVRDEGVESSLALDHAQPLNEEIPVSLRLEVSKVGAGRRAGLANSGYWGIPVRPRTSYRASFFAKTAGAFSGDVTLRI